MAQFAGIDPNRNSPPKPLSRRGKVMEHNFTNQLEPRKLSINTDQPNVEKSKKPDSSNRVRPAKTSDQTVVARPRSMSHLLKPPQDTHDQNLSTSQVTQENDQTGSLNSEDPTQDSVVQGQTQSPDTTKTDAEGEVSDRKDDDPEFLRTIDHEQKNTVETSKSDVPPSEIKIAPIVQASPLSSHIEDASLSASEPGASGVCSELMQPMTSSTREQAAHDQTAREQHPQKLQNGLKLPAPEQQDIQTIPTVEKLERTPFQASPTTVENKSPPKFIQSDESSSAQAVQSVSEKKLESAWALALSSERHTHAHSTATIMPPTTPTPSADATQTKPIPYPSLPIEIGLRILDGVKEISVDLSPKELGKLSVTITASDQASIQILFQTESPHTLSLLQNDASHIRHVLDQAGFATTDTSLQFSLRQDNSSNSNSGRNEAKKPFARKSGVTAISENDPAPRSVSLRSLGLSQLDLSV